MLTPQRYSPPHEPDTARVRARRPGPRGGLRRPGPRGPGELPGRGLDGRPDDAGAGGRALLVVERAVRRAVHRLSRLLPPALGELPVVERVVPDRLEKLGNRALPGVAVAGDRQSGAVGRARRAREV